MKIYYNKIYYNKENRRIYIQYLFLILKTEVEEKNG